ncbi:hypothetical protein SH661x_004040 [Planctomicrobium sp. SH661]|uniref:hypothetical protein n=1 Tax=Planctomicrobium sp. SH661 TaxID=3448124 RepID=UPI003F5CA07B
MKSLKAQLGVMLLAVVVAAAISGLAASLLIGVSGLWLALAAAAASIPAGVAVVMYIHRQGITPQSIVVATLMRMFLTAVVAGAAALAFEELRVPGFFLILGVIYLANLAVETWFALRAISSSRKIGTPS